LHEGEAGALPRGTAGIAKAREYMQVLRGAAARKERQGASSSAGVRAAFPSPFFLRPWALGAEGR